MKFRVWNKNRYDYVDNALIDTQGKAYSLGLGGMIEPIRSFEIDRAIGVKDSNGRVVYENDIVLMDNALATIKIDDDGVWLNGLSLRSCISNFEVVGDTRLGVDKHKATDIYFPSLEKEQKNES